MNNDRSSTSELTDGTTSKLTAALVESVAQHCRIYLDWSLDDNSSLHVGTAKWPSDTILVNGTTSPLTTALVESVAQHCRIYLDWSLDNNSGLNILSQSCWHNSTDRGSKTQKGNVFKHVLFLDFIWLLEV
jgi:hypothetical protein